MTKWKIADIWIEVLALALPATRIGIFVQRPDTNLERATDGTIKVEMPQGGGLRRIA